MGSMVNCRVTGSSRVPILASPHHQSFFPEGAIQWVYDKTHLLDRQYRFTFGADRRLGADMALAGVHIECRVNLSDDGRDPGRLSFCHQPLGGRPFAKFLTRQYPSTGVFAGPSNRGVFSPARTSSNEFVDWYTNAPHPPKSTGLARR